MHSTIFISDGAVSTYSKTDISPVLICGLIVCADMRVKQENSRALWIRAHAIKRDSSSSLLLVYPLPRDSNNIINTMDILICTRTQNILVYFYTPSPWKRRHTILHSARWMNVKVFQPVNANISGKNQTWIDVPHPRWANKYIKCKKREVPTTPGREARRRGFYAQLYSHPLNLDSWTHFFFSERRLLETRA